MFASVRAYGSPSPVPWLILPFASLASLWKKMLNILSLSLSGIWSPLLSTLTDMVSPSSDAETFTSILSLPYLTAFERRLLTIVTMESFAHIRYIGFSGMYVVSVMCWSRAVCSKYLAVFLTIPQMSSFVHESFISFCSIFLMSRSWFVRLSRRSALACIVRRSFSDSGVYAPFAISLSRGILIRVRGVRISCVMFVK